MTATTQAAMALLEQFKASFAKDELDSCVQQLAKLKLGMLSFSCLPPAIPSAPSSSQQQELLLAREILEYGALVSIKAVDIPAFERHIAQLKIYYTDCASMLPESPRQYPLLGLNLLRLLAQNRIAEFHTELELIPVELQTTNEYLKFPAELEQHIMEGSYNRVLSAKQTGAYASEGLHFMDMLVDTVRDEIAECSEKAYKSIALADLQTMLMLGTESELFEFATGRGWRIEGTLVTFGDEDEKPLSLPASQLIHESLAYAKELERIV
uniref:PCI domain-containing protein n=1 Tax=Strombidinopsis acuminata TaxID=141414 RepID=A0A7S3RTJ7_9SPIT